MKPRAKRKNHMKSKENSARPSIRRDQPAIANRKTKIGNAQDRKSQIANPEPRPPIANRKSKIKNPQYSIRKHIAFWSLTFNGQEACFDHEQGAYYVAYLLLNPPEEPIHGMALEIKSMAYFGKPARGAGMAEIVDPRTGRPVVLANDAIFQERNLGLDDAEAAAALREKQLELEAILDDEDQIEPVKAEVTRELLEIYDYQKRNPAQHKDNVERAVRAVRRAITRLHQRLARAVDAQGRPHAILRPFASHLGKYLLIPSARYGLGCRVKAGVASCFTYEPPGGVNWELNAH